MALPHTSCVFCDGVYLYDQCTCEAAVEGGLDSAPRCPCGAGRSLPATRAIAEGIDPGTRTHRTSDRPRGTRRQPLSIIARYYRSSACTAVVALQCIVTQTCMFQTSTCMLVACRTILRNFMFHVDQFRVFQLLQYPGRETERDPNHGEARSADAASWRGSEGGRRRRGGGRGWRRASDPFSTHTTSHAHTARSRARPILTPSSS